MIEAADSYGLAQTQFLLLTVNRWQYILRAEEVGYGYNSLEVIDED
jgi:hypothetical protein